MYLGELSPIQESRLVQLKGCISNLQKGKVPSDPILLRFLRARDFNVDKAREMLSQSLLWRKKHGVDKILSEYELPPVVKKYFPGKSRNWIHSVKLWCNLWPSEFINQFKHDWFLYLRLLAHEWYWGAAIVHPAVGTGRCQRNNQGEEVFHYSSLHFLKTFE